MKVGGVDVGIRKSVFAVIDGPNARVLESYEHLLSENVSAVGIDAPLSFPESGAFRECERELLRMGIRLFPSGVGFFRKVAERGMEIARNLQECGVEVYEVYPYATRVILGLAPEVSKRDPDGLIKIMQALSEHVRLDSSVRTHDDVDAVISAMTVMLYKKGAGRILSGKDGSILIPEPVRRKKS
ncbi:DUF429 domain-containing protein [Geoglobus sp.]